jgi:Mn2+/Fe2+ NRAMP family transporter
LTQLYLNPTLPILPSQSPIGIAHEFMLVVVSIDRLLVLLEILIGFFRRVRRKVILEGFLNWRIPCWIRRILTRILAIAPAVVELAVWGEAGVGKMLVLSQVVLSLQLPFAIVPLIWLTSQKSRLCFKEVWGNL